MAKLLSLEEANEIIGAMCSEYGIERIQFLRYYEEGQIRLNAFEYIPRSKRCLFKWWKKKHSIFTCGYDLEWADQKSD